MHDAKDNHVIPMTSVSAGKGREVAAGIFYYTDQIVNIIMIGEKNSNQWVLVDAGLKGSAFKIKKLAEERFGGAQPGAIIITHGHFDHVGSLVHLLEDWKVPVYAHPLEFPFLTGAQSYPKPDTSVEGGVLAKISFMYPIASIDIHEVLLPLPVDGSIPFLPGWKWIHVPGHSPGQVALFRESDRTLISADAFVRVKQDSLYNVLIQKEEVCGPPVYLTTDWQVAWDSVRRLAALNPSIAITGHGTAMQGNELSEGLQKLVEEFNEIAIPSHGKYVYSKEEYH